MSRHLSTAVLVLPLLVGCSNIQGTWISKGGADTPNNPIGRVTFADDGTFTAEADYGPQGGKRAMSGTYTYDMMKGKLNLEADGQKRDYELSIKGSEMTIWKPIAGAPEASKSGSKPTSATMPHKFTMTRMQGKSMWKM